MLAERATRNAAQVEAAYGGNNADGGDALGPDSGEDMIQEYENEEQVATVTVVEDLDIDALIHPVPPSGHPNPASSSNHDHDQGRHPEHAQGSKCTITNGPSAASKKKAAPAKKIKYETKAARLAEKKKQQARKFEKAARAGGKQTRSSKRRR